VIDDGIVMLTPNTEHPSSKMEGTIKTMKEGYGFIAREGEAKDLFFHANDLNGTPFNELKVGDKVSFDVEEGPKGPAAKNVTRI